MSVTRKSLTSLTFKNCEQFSKKESHLTLATHSLKFRLYPLLFATLAFIPHSESKRTNFHLADQFSTEARPVAVLCRGWFHFNSTVADLLSYIRKAIWFKATPTLSVIKLPSFISKLEEILVAVGMYVLLPSS